MDPAPSTQLPECNYPLDSGLSVAPQWIPTQCWQIARQLPLSGLYQSEDCDKHLIIIIIRDTIRLSFYRSLMSLCFKI